MHIVIDMQGAQTSSRVRGIGRYTRGLVSALLDCCKNDKVTLLLNGMLPEGQQEVFATFCGSVAPEDIRVWNGPVHSQYQGQPSVEAKVQAEKCYEDAIIRLQPDVVLVTSVLAESEDNFTCSLSRISRYAVIAAISYDFLPMHSPEKYLGNDDSPQYHLYYDKLALLKHVDVFFAISEFVAEETKTVFPQAVSTNVGTDADAKFCPVKNGICADALRKKYGISEKFIFYAGGIDPRKKLDEVLAAYLLLPANIAKHTQLVLAADLGKAVQANAALNALLEEHQAVINDRVVFTGYIADEDLAGLYSCCNVFVFASSEEGFGLTVLEAMRCGAAVVAAKAPSLVEVLGESGAFYRPGDVASFAQLIGRAVSEPSFNEHLRMVSRDREQLFSWKTSATRCRDIARELVSTRHREKYPADPFHRPINNPVPSLKLQKNFFIDISSLVECDYKTGVQRVVRSIVNCLLHNPIEGYAVRPVYFCNNQKKFIQAHTYLWENMLWDDNFESDQPVAYVENDFFLRLDLCFAESAEKKNYIRKMHDDGVCIYTVVYDLIPVEYPEYAPESSRSFSEWLADLSNFDGAVCISKATADSLRKWQRNFDPNGREAFAIEWFHLGNDVESSAPSSGLPEDAQEVLNIVRSMPTVLMVGTVEPRKGCAQALDAFDLLWRNGEKVALVLVGSDGWKVDGFIERVAEHPQLGKKLFRLKHVSDQYLEELYRAASVVLMASEVEGFGLPVIEAARYKKSLILRDIPVFREIAGENALYFRGGASDLANSVLQWIALDTSGAAPTSEGIRCLTWEESARMLLGRLPLKESSKPLTVLFNTWPAAFDCPGGGEIQLLQYEKHLNEAGVRVLRYDPWNPQFDEADLLHTFSVMGGTWFLPYYAHEVRKLPVVNSPIIWIDQPEKYAMDEIAANLRWADLILPNSIAECAQLQEHFGINSERLTPIFNGIDNPFFEPVSEEIFRDHFNMRDEFVLCMGNIEPRKNQLNLIRALAGSDIKLVVIGQERDLAYAAQCRDEASDNIFFLGKVPHGSPLQRSAYEAAKAVVLTSVLETPGLSVLEAAACGTPVVVTSEGCAEEYFGAYGIYCDPDSVGSIRNAVCLATTLPKNFALRQHVYEKFRWQYIVTNLISSYQEIVNAHSAKTTVPSFGHVREKSIVFVCADDTTAINEVEFLKRELVDKCQAKHVCIEEGISIFPKTDPDCYVFWKCLPTEGHLEIIGKRRIVVCTGSTQPCLDSDMALLLQRCFFISADHNFYATLQEFGLCGSFLDGELDADNLWGKCSGTTYPNKNKLQPYSNLASIRHILNIDRILFTSQKSLFSGWLPAEGGGIWSAKEQASLTFDFLPGKYDLSLELTCLQPQKNPLWDVMEILVNGTPVNKKFELLDGGQKRLYSSIEDFVIDDRCVLTIDVKKCLFSEKELGFGADVRKLGVFISKISMARH